MIIVNSKNPDSSIRMVNSVGHSAKSGFSLHPNDWTVFPMRLLLSSGSNPAAKGIANNDFGLAINRRSDYVTAW